MAETRRGIARVAIDADHTFYHGLLPVDTMWQLKQGKFHLPPHETVEAEKPHNFIILGLLGQGLAWLSNEMLYGWRFPTSDAKVYLPEIKELVAKRGYLPKTVILSGRDEGKRTITERKLIEAGCRGEFEAGDDGILLNDGSGSSISKERRVKDWLKQGDTVIVFEDDLKTALCEDRALGEVQKENGGKAGRLLVYVINNPRTNPFYNEEYLKRNRIKLPAHIKIVRNFAQAYEDLHHTFPRFFFRL